MFKKINILIVLFLMMFLLSSCNEDNIEYQKQYETYSVGTGSLEISNSFVGYISGYIETILSTKIGGRITYLDKKIGDKVIAGEKLLSLDSSEAKTSYSTASNIIQVLQDLKTSTIKTYDDQIKAMESKINQALIYYNGTLQGIDDTNNISTTQLDSQTANIKTAELSLETAELNLEETKRNLELEKEHILKNSKTAIVNSVILYNNILTYIDSILGITDENIDKNDDFEDYLSAKDSSYLSIGEEDFNNSLVLFKEYKKIYEEKIENSLLDNLSDEEILIILEKGEKTGELLKTLLKTTWNILDNTISSVGKISEDEILSYKNQISDFGTQVESSILTVSGNYLLGLKGSIQSIEDFNSNKQTTLLLLEKQVLLAQNNLDGMNKTYLQIQAQTSGQLTDIETNSSIAKNSLNELYASLDALKSEKNTKIKEIDSQITQASGNKNSAGINIDNGEILAPFDGIITSKTGELGQVVGAGNPIFTLSDNSKVKLNLSLPDYIISNLNIGDDLEVNIEGLEENFIATITNIPNTKDPVTKKTLVELIIDNSLEKIKVGSMGSVIFLENSEDIIIPNSSIISDFLIPSVYVLNGNKVELKNIEIIEQSNNFSSVKGLEIGDIIISSGKENIYNGEEL